MIRVGRWSGPAALALLLVASVGCASGNAYRRGQNAAKKGDWDAAVAGLTKASDLQPRNIAYKIALENARIRASRYHYEEAKKHIAAHDFDKAADELQIASNFDPSNKSASDDLEITKEKIRKREEERARLAQYDAMKGRAAAVRVPVPVLSPRSPVPITIKFADQSLQKILESLGKLAGVNVIFDPDYRDKRWSLDLSGVTFEEALNQITFANRLFYKVLDQNTVIVIAESAAKRKIYDENLVQTFYLENAEVNETLQLIKTLAGIQKAAGNPSLGAITVTGTPDELALAARIIDNNDKARGEVMVEVNILEVSRVGLKKYGIELSQYEVQSTFRPTGATTEVVNGFTNLRAHLLSSVNLSDFVVSIPSTLFARFLQTDSSVRIVAAPKLRASEGKKTTLRIGQEVPIPVTTFTAAAQGGDQTFVPATSFQYRNVGVSLDLTPKVNAVGEIVLEIAAEFSLLGDNRNVGSEGNPLNVPTFLTRNVTGILRVRDGETSLIGGLIQGRDAETLRGAMGLQSIPLLGKLFRSNQKDKDELEVLISLTPHLVRAPKLTEADLTPLLIGTKDYTRVLSARPSLFADEPPAVAAPAPVPFSAVPGVPAVPPVVALPVPAPEPVPTPTPTPPPPSGPESMAVPPGLTEGNAPVAGPAEAPSTVRSTARAVFSPAEARVRVGETATVSVVLIGARNVTAADVAVVYDASVVEALEIVPGTLLTLDGQSIQAEQKIEAGRASARFTRELAATGSGAVAVLRFRALKAGNASLNVAAVTLMTPVGSESATVQGPGAVVVEP
jgi:general secretion pathway protein D